jgi:GrpB-like predicted nucleotidyltransferase (UPF0157 family)
MARGRFQTKLALLACVAFGKGLEDLISLKIRFFQRGNANDSDLHLLDYIHEVVLHRLRQIRVRGEIVLTKAEVSGLGIHDSKVLLAAHDPKWQDSFYKEAEALWKQLGDRAVQIHHVGSTAVPGLPAKPIIDIAIEMNHVAFDEGWNACHEALSEIGYNYLGDRGQKGGRMFAKSQNGKRTYAIQVHPSDAAALRELIEFRQMLLNDDILRREYAEVKAALAELFPSRRLIYVWYKTHWVQDLFLDKGSEHAWGRWLVKAQIRTMVGILMRSVWRKVW